MKNVGASIRQRLLNKARDEKRAFQELLQYFAMERFLYPLSRSEHAHQFVLKGALVLRAWDSPNVRTTMDIDLLGLTSNNPSNIAECIRRILEVAVDDDGLHFDTDSIRTDIITEAADYEGIRVRFTGTLDSAIVRMQIDVGFGDIVFPPAETLRFSTILDLPEPVISCYSKESIIAEKFEAMLALGQLNSRMKDFYDVYSLSQNFDFDPAQLAEAIKRTLENRKTPIPRNIVAFSHEFAKDKQPQWAGFLNRIEDINTPRRFADISRQIKEFLDLPISIMRKE